MKWGWGCMKWGSGRTRTDTDGLPITVNYSGNNLVYYQVKIGLAQETITV